MNLIELKQKAHIYARNKIIEKEVNNRVSENKEYLKNYVYELFNEGYFTTKYTFDGVYIITERKCFSIHKDDIHLDIDIQEIIHKNMFIIERYILKYLLFSTLKKDNFVINIKNDDHIDYLEFINEYLNRKNIYLTRDDMRRYDMIVPKFLKYVTNKLYKNRYLSKSEKVKYSSNCIIFSNINEALSYEGNKAVLFDGDLILQDKKIVSLKNIREISGTLDLSSSNLSDLGILEKIGGDVYFSGSRITSLNNLKVIDGFADLRESFVNDLGSLEEVGSHIDIRYTYINNLSKLKKVGGYFYLSDPYIIEDNLETVDFKCKDVIM